MLKTPNFVTDRELTEYTGIPQKIISQKAESGEWPHYYIGRQRIFPLAKIIRIAVGGDAEPEARTDD